MESPFISRVVGESVFDFYAGIFSRSLTARRIFARVESIRHETPSTKSFTLRPNGHFRGFLAGQHVNLTVEIDGVRHTRCYSPSNAPDRTGAVIVTVKRHPGGLVSNWLHDRVRSGDWVELSQAFGDFTAPADPTCKLLLIAAGSGITPVASILRDISRDGAACDVVALVYGRTSTELIFRDELLELERRHRGVRVTFVTTREGGTTSGDLAGHFSQTHLDRVAPDARERHAFVCGPPALVEDVRALWARQGSAAPLKTETFTPVGCMVVKESAAPPAFEVTTTKSLRRFAADGVSSLLVQAERAGLNPKSGCRQGICFTCACRKEAGVVRNVVTGAVSAEPGEDIRLCVSTPLSNLTLDL